MPITTPSGRGLGRRRDAPDFRDLRYSKVHRMRAPTPRKVDLSDKFPPCWDQGEEGSCGPHSAVALACFLWPDHVGVGFSRQLLYWLVRHKYEGSGDADNGVQTRDLFRVMQNYGVSAPEAEWPYDKDHFAKAPTDHILKDASEHKIGTYTRLVQTASILDCLASGFPFILGFEVYESLDSDQVAKGGVWALPNPSEQLIGGHDVTVVGYDLDFKSNPDLKASGIDPARVSDRALLIRNSWGVDWGLKAPVSHKGHFWMSLEYATNPSTGGDAWTARL